MIHPSKFRWSLDVLHDNEEVTFNGSIGYSDIPPKKVQTLPGNRRLSRWIFRQLKSVYNAILVVLIVMNRVKVIGFTEDVSHFLIYLCITVYTGITLLDIFGPFILISNISL